jgi:hypothetical protein
MVNLLICKVAKFDQLQSYYSFDIIYVSYDNSIFVSLFSTPSVPNCSSFLLF